MQVFVAAFVASLGIGLYAVAALVWDRRHQLAELFPGARNAAGTPGTGATGSNRRLAPHAIVLGAVVLGTIMIFGSCMGLFL